MISGFSRELMVSAGLDAVRFTRLGRGRAISARLRFRASSRGAGGERGAGVRNKEQERRKCEGNARDQRKYAAIREGRSEFTADEEERDAAQGLDGLKVAVDPIRIAGTRRDSP